MKFTCERCSAQYMISDEKVGPSGVKVRCKKCGNVIHVRQAGSAAPAAPNGSAAPDPGAPSLGLDAELGQAFESAFGAAASTSENATAPKPEAPAEPTKAPEPPATEWYVAIGQAQVGPLPLSDVKKKWEESDIGPDSLVWRPGMADWAPLSSVADLAAYLAPVARLPARNSREVARSAGQPSSQASPAGKTPAAPETAWKPQGASALAALASEEIAARSAPAPAKPAPIRTSGSLVDAMNLPDGGVDPTGAVPLPLKGMETGERRLSSVAAQAKKTRRSRGILIGLSVAVVVACLAVAAAVWSGVVHLPFNEPPTPAKLVEATPRAPAPGPPTTVTAPVQPPTPPIPAATAAPPAPPPAAPEAVPLPKPVEPAPAVAQEKPGPTVAKAPTRRHEPTRHDKRTRREEKLARAEPPREDAKPAPAPAPPKKSGGVLDFEDNDTALNEALGGAKSPSGRSVYVPPAAGGGGSNLPEKISTAQIQESVAGRVDALRRCVAEQKVREPGATGVLKMGWFVNADGSPANVKCLTSEFASGQFAACIGGVIRNIRFPKAQNGQEVTFPFNF